MLTPLPCRAATSSFAIGQKGEYRAFPGRHPKIQRMCHGDKKGQSIALWHEGK